MNGYELSRRFFDFAFEHHECGVYHTAIYMLAIDQNNRYGWKKEFGFPTAYNCDVLGIGNRNTYLSALNDLVKWGFIEIICESKNQFKATVISICHIKIDIAQDTAGYTALDKALIWQDTCHGYAIDTIDKQLNKETKKPVNKETILSEESERTDFTKIEKVDKRNKDVQSVIDAIIEINGSVGGSPTKERQFASHLSKKIKSHPLFLEVRGQFETDEEAISYFVKSLIQKADDFQKRYTASPQGLYYHMEEILLSNNKKRVGVLS